MTEDKVVSKYKKTDEPSDVNDEIPVKFSLLDVLRILTGILVLYCACCKIWTGNWYSLGFKSSRSSDDGADRSSVGIPDYWLQARPGPFPIAFSLEELSEYSGSKDSDRILLSVRGHVFDVTRGSKFYGKWGTYKKFTGTDCSKVLSYPPYDISALSKPCSSDLSDSTAIELARVESWLQFYQKNYPEIGYVKELLDT